MANEFAIKPVDKIDKLVEQVVIHARERAPQLIDRIFDSLSAQVNDQILHGVLFVLSDDVDTLSWLCGYFASEINSSEDNDKLHKPITLLSKLLIRHGMRPFDDFMPYTGCRLTIFNTDKFEMLPEHIRVMVRAFDLTSMSGEDFKKINDALMQEMVCNT